MKKDPQGKRWHRLDNTGKIFPMIANENLSNVFRISVILKHDIVPNLLQQALQDTLPMFKGFKVKLKRGFFWYYFEGNKRTPYIEKETSWPCRYIDPKSSQLYLFRVSYYGRRINLEVFHAVTDGMGAVNFIRELTARYLDLKNGTPHLLREEEQGTAYKIEDSYLKNYKKMPGRRYSSKPAYRMEGEYLAMGGESVVHGTVDIQDLKRVCREKGVSVTKYLTASLIWSICQVYMGGTPGTQSIGINLPINLRAFFGSDTASNFFAVTAIDYNREKGDGSFDSILAAVCSQMDDNIVKEKLEQTISYNVSNEKKWYVRILPLFVKWLALGFIFRRNDRAHTMTLSNIGPITMDEEYREEIENFHLLIGVSKRQPAKCGVCAYEGKVNITFTKVFGDSRLEDCFFGHLEQAGIPVGLESNGLVTISYNVSNEKKWYVRILPLFVKWLALGFIFRRNDRAHTMTLSNIGPITMDEEYREEIENFHLLIGVSKRQPAKCGVCAYEGKVNITFTKVFGDSRLEDCFFGHLEQAGIPVGLESNGLVKPEAWKGTYPVVEYDKNKWKKLVYLFYGILAVVAVVLGVVNIATYDHLWWSGIAIPGIAYAGLTVRYSILKHANLGKTVVIETIGMQVLLIMIDRVLGYEGWSVNYAVPATILFADVAVVFLILVNRLNWQSYFMYQLAITIFSFIPLILWAVGLVTRPLMAFITVVLTVFILAMTIFLGDRGVKNELIRRFHL